MDIFQTIEILLLLSLFVAWWLGAYRNNVLKLDKMVLDSTPPWCFASKESKSKIPGPTALPILGTSWVYSKLGGYTFSQVHTYYKDMVKKYGPVAKEEALWNVPVISVFTRADIEKVLKESGRYPIRPPTEAIAQYRRSRKDRYASTGIVNEQGEQWQNLRTNLTSDLTSSKTISSYLPELENIADDFCHLLKTTRNSKSQVLHVEELASRLGLETICCLVLGRRMGFLLNKEINESSIQTRLATAVANHFVACRDTYYGLPLWKLYPTKAYTKLSKSEEEIYDLVLEIIQSAKVDDPDICAAIFQSVLSAHIDPREKTAAIVDFIAAGIYTMRNTLVFLLDAIAKHQHTQEKLLQDGAYLRACINEAFRLTPTAICLARVTQSELELSGYPVPAGSVVLCQTAVACRDDANFYKANEFLPERWLDAEKTNTSSAATFLVIPFGVGRRTCPGKRFIEQSLPVLLRRIIQEFAVKNERELDLQFEFLLAPKGPVTMIFEDR